MSYAGIATIIYLIEAFVIVILILVIVLISKAKKEKAIGESNRRFQEKIRKQNELKRRDIENDKKIDNANTIDSLLSATDDILQDNTDNN